MQALMFAVYRYGLVIYACILQPYFITVPESYEYGKIQIMYSIKEPNTGKTQMLNIFTIIIGAK